MCVRGGRGRKVAVSWREAAKTCFFSKVSQEFVMLSSRGRCGTLCVSGGMCVCVCVCARKS